MSKSPNEIRLFLAHDINTPDTLINEWRDQLTDQLTDEYGDDATITVVAGRDGYNARFKVAGGWKGWPRSVFEGTTWDGAPLFNGIVRPVTGMSDQDLVCGRATFDMIKGFLGLNKTVWAWCPESQEIAMVDGAENTSTDFKAYGVLSLRAQR